MWRYVGLSPFSDYGAPTVAIAHAVITFGVLFVHIGVLFCFACFCNQKAASLRRRVPKRLPLASSEGANPARVGNYSDDEAAGVATSDSVGRSRVVGAMAADVGNGDDYNDDEDGWPLASIMGCYRWASIAFPAMPFAIALLLSPGSIVALFSIGRDGAGHGDGGDEDKSTSANAVIAAVLAVLQILLPAVIAFATRHMWLCPAANSNSGDVVHSQELAEVRGGGSATGRRANTYEEVGGRGGAAGEAEEEPPTDDLATRAIRGLFALKPRHALPTRLHAQTFEGKAAKRMDGEAAHPFVVGEDFSAADRVLSVVALFACVSSLSPPQQRSSSWLSLIPAVALNVVWTLAAPILIVGLATGAEPAIGSSSCGDRLYVSAAVAFAVASAVAAVRPFATTALDVLTTVAFASLGAVLVVSGVEGTALYGDRSLPVSHWCPSPFLMSCRQLPLSTGAVISRFHHLLSTAALAARMGRPHGMPKSPSCLFCLPQRSSGSSTLLRFSFLWVRMPTMMTTSMRRMAGRKVMLSRRTSQWQMPWASARLSWTPTQL